MLKNFQQEVILGKNDSGDTAMNMGDRIKKLRTDFGLTQEQLGAMLVPPVQKSAIAKWETGRVSNIKRHHIQQLTEIFDIDPTELFSFGENEQMMISIQERTFLEMYRKLDDIDKARMLERCAFLLEADKYRKKGKGAG